MAAVGDTQMSGEDLDNRIVDGHTTATSRTRFDIVSS